MTESEVKSVLGWIQVAKKLGLFYVELPTDVSRYTRERLKDKGYTISGELVILEEEADDS